jgi:hypothetical protein
MIPIFILVLVMLAVAAVGMAYHGTGVFTPTWQPAWLKDVGDRNTLLPGGVSLLATAFPRFDAVAITVNGAGAAQNATALPVAATSGPLLRGTRIVLSNGVVATLTADAATGATSLAVSALSAAVAAGVTGTYPGVRAPFAAEGTFIGRTEAERLAKTPFSPWVAGDTETYLLVHDVPDLTVSTDATVVRPGRLIATNLLPGWSLRPAGEQAAINARYQAILGQP